MRITLLIVIFAAFSNLAAAQKKDPPPPVPQTMPGKDPAVSIDKILAGKSKKYHWHSSYALLDIDEPAMTGSHINVLLNGRIIMRRYESPHPKRKIRKLPLKNGRNTIVIQPYPGNKTDSFALNMSLGEKKMDHRITVQLKNGMSDTLIIIKH